MKHLLLLSFTLLIFAFGCKKDDDCKDVVCYNGGVCVSGDCDCPPGFTGTQCENSTTGPCAGITCQNGGTCSNGTCTCPTGWTGTLCQTPVTNDPCSNINCQNGGTCNNGTCNCPNGWTGTLCQTPVTTNPCANITCLNGGTCANGLCNCPSGWGGSDCGTSLTPTSMRITKVEVTNFPATNNGAGWDFTSGPDLYVQVLSGSTILFDSNYFEDAIPGNLYTFTPSSPILISNPTGTYVIRAYDYDSLDPDDFMGGFNFQPLQPGKPAVYTITNSSVTVLTFKVYFTYQY